MEKPTRPYPQYLLIAAMLIAGARLGIDALDKFAGRWVVASNLTADMVLLLLLVLVHGQTYSNDSANGAARYLRWLVPVCFLLGIGAAWLSSLWPWL
jgi:hypothetical protein